MRGYVWFIVMNLGLLTVRPATAQEKVSLSLEEVWRMAEAHYPQTRNPEMINEVTTLQRSALQRQYLPQLTVSGQATYQSEVTQVKIPVPGVNVPVLNKDQYKALADLNQLIFDGGLIHTQREAQLVNGKVEQEKQAVELYKLKERICQIYMGLLFLNQQLAQVALVEKDLSLGVARAEAQVKSGTAFRSQLLLMQAEFLKAGQRRTELLHARKAWQQALEYYTQSSIADMVQLQEPDFSVERDFEISRPELNLIRYQQQYLGLQEKQIGSRNQPKASLFMQGGYGRPGLNFLENKFSLFYLGGIRLNWALAGFYTQKKDKQILQVNRQLLESQKETYLLNTRVQLSQQWEEIQKLEELIASDREIISIRQAVTVSVKAQFEQGVITANDYIREVNAEDQVRQNLIQHQVQLVQAKLQYRLTAGRPLFSTQ